MKKSLFKRAIAVAAAAPLALTQCLINANAESNDAVQTTATAQAESSSKITLDDLLYIPANKTVSDWNQLVWAKLATRTQRDGTFNLTELAKEAVEHAGQFKDVADYALNELIIPNGVKYQITDNNDVVITGHISEPDFNRNLSLTSGNALAIQAENYKAPNLTKIDFSDISVEGDFKITFETSKLGAGTEVPIKFEYKTTADNKVYAAGQLFDLALDTMAKVKAKGDAALEKEIPAQFVDKAKADYAEKIKNVTDKIEKAKRNFEKALKAEKSGEYANVAGVIAKANTWLKNHNINKQIPATATDIAAKSIVTKAYDQLLNDFSQEHDINITAADLGKFADSLENIKGSLAKAVANGEATFKDAEQAEVKAYVESLGYAFVDSYKKVTAKVDFSGINTTDAGSVAVKIERVLVTNTTSTTSSTTTTTTTTTESTTSTTESTTESTTSSSTTSTTESTTSSTTTESTTSTTESTTSTTESTTSSTSSSTTSTTESTTSSTTTTVPPEVVETTSIIKSYVTADTQPAYYVSIEDAFDKAQISNVVLHERYIKGYEINGKNYVSGEGENTKDITADVNFGLATPSNTYQSGSTSFKYEVPVYANGEVLKDIDGKNVTVTVYIALKGDANLDNLVDSNDASQVLAYYAKVSTNNTDVYSVNLSKSALATSPTSEYEEFAAFLADVHYGADKNVERSVKKDNRLIDSNDAAYILAFYARRSSADYNGKTDRDIWNEVLKKA
ncbi:cellulose-binding protein CttA-related protein [Ruminococcus flavefaciens]|uniref:Putative cellulose-binding protein n=1 Tax=Ruminococcus flavefaciens TaxID=1265 RepID=A6H572_RUMFL|nr:cellulose-binding protein CttA-related protein [Ruminococcus flavefaciens]CAO00731.1 putative cellulose-binding protein precursor [Ruminococcus flavefaciens]